MKSRDSARLVLGLIFASVVLFIPYASGDPVLQGIVNPASNLFGVSQPQDIVFTGTGFTSDTVIELSDLTSGGVYIIEERPFQSPSGELAISVKLGITPSLWMARAGIGKNGPWSAPIYFGVNDPNKIYLPSPPIPISDIKTATSFRMPIGQEPSGNDDLGNDLNWLTVGSFTSGYPNQI